MIEQYYNRFNSADNYEQVMFRADRVLQSAELNEIQSATMARLKSIGEALFKDGDIVRDARIQVNADTGETVCEAGAVFLRGCVRGVAPATFTLPITGDVTVGIYLKENVVTELEAPALRNPSVGTRGYQEPGAARLKVVPVWGHEADGQSGEFYPVYQVENGMLRAKEAPPNLDGVTQALARYDRDSSGGSYVVSGLNVAQSADIEGNQVYTVSEGRARVNGFGVAQATSRRITYPAAADMRTINSELHTSQTAASQRINLTRPPHGGILSVSVVMEKTVTVTHGYGGGQDALPDTSIVSLVLVKQGATTFEAGTEYRLTAERVDWSPSGPKEPEPGSQYEVTYRYRALVTPTNVDSSGFSITGAVTGTEIHVSYYQKLPRIDRLCINADGEFVWLKGVSAEFNPQPPSAPDSMLALASVHQTWGADRSVVNDGVRVVPMNELANINARMDRLASLIAQQMLKSDAANRDASVKKGMFVDPFLNDDLRDAGVMQTAAIFGGKLTLPVTAAASQMSTDVNKPTALPYTLATALSQQMRTTDMAVNPYMAFDPIPATVQLIPAIDNWTEVNTVWASDTTRRMVVGSGLQSRIGTFGTFEQLVSSSSQGIDKLRQIDVRFNISGFGAGETLNSVTFDGISVTPTA
jgi:hypothetical protein